MLFDAYTQDIEVARYMVWRPHTALAETEAFIAQCIQDWAAGHRQPYVVALREDVHHAVGMLEARTPSHVVDIGYVLARSLWGRGSCPRPSARSQRLRWQCQASFASRLRAMSRTAPLRAHWRSQASCGRHGLSATRFIQTSALSLVHASCMRVAGSMCPNPSIERTRSGLRPPWSVEAVEKPGLRIYRR